MTKHWNRLTCRLCVWLCCFTAAGQQPAPIALNIVVLEGQGAIHNIRQRATADAAVIRVVDDNQQPVPGVSVAFTLPSQGAGGSFPGSEKTLIVTTDAEGKAAARGLKPNAADGKFEIRVTASLQGKTASATVTQFNMAVQSSKPNSGGNGKWIAIVLLAGAGGAAGAVLGARGSSSAPAPPAAPPSISITAGTGSVGSPQ
jgi:hypothetical protein